MHIEFKRLTDVNKTDIIDLMNNELVRRQMPLLKGDFSESDCDKFIHTKEELWEKFGYGPWAFVVDGRFVGWGGVQPENGDADLGLVLHPDYWGIGITLYKKIIDKAFNGMGLKSVTILFPPTRTRINGILRLGFKKDGEFRIGNEQFIRYRLENAAMNKTEWNAKA